ncbi:HlyD family secretion protein [Lyngbya confervoides]|uniref:HlyD family efflux transporter periplasmic adaptor subunit n=1 Tax=Lyngbya confervoides BDU141951 TaxID=1574623 RepID=A0ABD4T6C2_9CYAN|nr:HlyD family efflux transporter periplasmic adaptor subunit [Lyngbya confervoides]MCM1983785.1 HlyD family efflux transporter periplasmic adaptor subunit [Lyngbya confervoides BDU141951]
MTEAPTPKRSLPKPLRIGLPILIVVAIAAGVARQLLQQPQEPGLQLSGRIEGYETDVGAKVGGKIESIAVREGDRVRSGQVIARLEDEELRAALTGAMARIAAAQQQVSQAFLQLGVIDTQIAEAKLAQQQAQDDTAGRMNAAKAAVAAAQAQLAQAQAQVKQLQAELNLAQADRDRFATLVREGAVSQQRFDQAQTQYESLRELLQARQAAVTTAQEQVNVAQGNLTQSGASQLNPEIRAAQVQRLQTQLAQAQAQLRSAQAEVETARSYRRELEARLRNLDILSPIAGIVLTRTTEPGEVIAAGKTVLTVVNLDEVYLRGFIPEKNVGEVRVGQAAQVYLDSDPHRPLAAQVSAIDTEASFTPENIYFRDDRVTQVFGLKLQIENPNGLAKPGMPADARILPEASSPSPREG